MAGRCTWRPQKQSRRPAGVEISSARSRHTSDSTRLPNHLAPRQLGWHQALALHTNRHTPCRWYDVVIRVTVRCTRQTRRIHTVSVTSTTNGALRAAQPAIVIAYTPFGWPNTRCQINSAETTKSQCKSQGSAVGVKENPTHNTKQARTHSTGVDACCYLNIRESTREEDM